MICFPVHAVFLFLIQILAVSLLQKNSSLYIFLLGVKSLNALVTSVCQSPSLWFQKLILTAVILFYFQKLTPKYWCFICIGNAKVPLVWISVISQ